MRINDSGLVNIGSGGNASGISPLLHLHKAASNATAFFHITNADTGITNNDGFVFGYNSSRDALIFNKEDTPMRFATNGQERMRIDSSGNVGIGTSSPASLLHVSSSTTSYFRFQDLATETIGLIVRKNTTSTYTAINFKNGNGNSGNLTVSTGSVSLANSSDYRLKENETVISDGITKIKQLIPRRFNFKTEPSKTLDGFFAHEVSGVVPEAVFGEKDATIDEDGNGYQSLDPTKLIPILTAGLKEAIAKIETLETKVAALEAA